jgi:hypothetical protein
MRPARPTPAAMRPTPAATRPERAPASRRQAIPADRPLHRGPRRSAASCGRGTALFGRCGGCGVAVSPVEGTPSPPGSENKKPRRSREQALRERRSARDQTSARSLKRKSFARRAATQCPMPVERVRARHKVGAPVPPEPFPASTTRSAAPCSNTSSRPTPTRWGDLDVRGRGGFTAALTRPGLEVADEWHHATCHVAGVVSWAPRVSHRFVICPGRPESMT